VHQWESGVRGWSRASQRWTMPPLGLGRGGDVVRGHPMFETPGLRPQASQRCSETPLREASDEAGIWAGLLTRLAGGLARGDLAHGSSSIDFSLK
jgi:hypothetical protein